METLRVIIYPKFNEETGEFEDISWLFFEPDVFDPNFDQLPA